jgi:hypothetical protein
MPEVARTLAFLSALLIVLAFAIWAKWLRGPLLQRLDGTRASNNRPAQLAIQLLMLALGVSAVAAVLAIVGWIAP